MGTRIDPAGTIFSHVMEVWRVETVALGRYIRACTLALLHIQLYCCLKMSFLMGRNYGAC